MTKIKNTKKGMAKKTLSMSLVVAMLATSNVPVWAAEFSDGTDAAVETEAPAAETFSDDAVETPVVEDTDATAASSVVTDGDITVDLTADKKSVIWGDDVNVSGKIINKTTGEDLTSWKYRWVNESGISVDNGEGTDTTLNTGLKLTTDDTLAGKTLTLYIYNDVVDATNGAKYNINTGITVTVEKRELSDFTLTATPEYNGFSQSVAESAVSNVLAVEKAATGTTPAVTATVTDKDTYTITSSSATNAGDTITVTVSAKEDSAYKGSVSKSVTIDKRDYSTHFATNKYSDIDADVTKGLTYQYTGDTIFIPTKEISLKETKKEKDGEDKLNGADLSSAIVSASVAKEVGDKTVSVTVDTEKLTNFKNVSSPFTTNEKVTIKKRDLSAAGTTIKMKYTNVPTNTDVADLAKYLTFTGTEGSKLTLAYGVDYKISATTTGGDAVTTLGSTGTYIVTVSAVAGDDKNCTGSQTFKVSTVRNVLTEASCSNLAAKKYTPHYTGSAITPSKDDLGTLTVTGTAGDPEELQATEWEITGYTNNIDATTYKTASSKNPVGDSANQIKTQAYVNIKILNGAYKGETCRVAFNISPLKVEDTTIKVPTSISYNKSYTKAEEYNVPVTVVAKTADKKYEKTLDASDFTVKYEYENGAGSATQPTGNSTGATNEIHDKIKATVTITNKNYILGSDDANKYEIPAAESTEIVAKALSDSMIKVNPSSYTYTGGKITPSYVVLDGAIALYEGKDKDTVGEYEVVDITDSVNVGTGKIKIKGINDFYSGEATGTFTITAADTKDVKVSIDDAAYTGKQIRPRTFKATLNGNDVSDQFEIVSYGENVKAGKGTVVIRPVSGNKNFTGSDITAEFNIVNEFVKGTLNVYDEYGISVTPGDTNAFTFDGNAKTFAKEVLASLKKTNSTGTDTATTKAKASDFEIKYVDNVSGAPDSTYTGCNVAYVYAVAKEGSGYAGWDTIKTADGNIIKGVVAKKAFYIKSVQFNAKNVTLKNGTYAAGLPVKPEVLIQIGGNTLVEGKDYKLELIGGSTYTDVTNGAVYGVKITGINGYANSTVITNASNNLKWGIDKKNISDCTVTVKDGVVTVLNGYIPVASTEYTSKNNGDGTYTVTANKDSKNYTGSKTVNATGKAEDEKPNAPMISSVKVVGNKATVILSGDSEGAAGYDYVISTDRDCITNKDYASVNKNQVQTSTTFKYVQQGTYYAYCHAWKRDANGKKVFSDWSNAYPFVVSAITPDAPVITNVTVSGSTIKVTYKAAANATGYDVVLGTSSKKENGETRPYNYGAHKKLNLKEGTVTATFKNVPKGTWTVGMHAFNRTSEDGKKVFSPWSNLKKATVK